ncbi:MAG TPA: hypothetical protein VNW92_28665, partial [Polyangiaceae bacterium]|nr:hypothetical protein [Polyangiaceae bacterium]
MTNSNQLLRTWAAFGTLAVTAFGLASACGSSDNLTCGSGTQKHGTQCIVAASTGGSGGDSSSGGSSDTGGTDAGALVPGPVFGGVITAAPATDVAVQVTWAPATDALTDPKD